MKLNYIKKTYLYFECKVIVIELNNWKQVSNMKPDINTNIFCIGKLHIKKYLVQDIGRYIMYKNVPIPKFQK